MLNHELIILGRPAHIGNAQYKTGESNERCFANVLILGRIASTLLAVLSMSSVSPHVYNNKPITNTNIHKMIRAADQNTY